MTKQPQDKKEAASSIWKDFRGLSKLWPDLKDHKRLILMAGCLIPVISGLQMASPMAIRYIVDDGIVKRVPEAISLGATIFLGIVVIEYLSRATQGFLAAKIVHRMVKSLRNRLIRHVLRLRLSYHDRNLSGTLVTRATSDFDNLSESLNMGVLNSVVDLAVLVGCVIGMLMLNVKLTLVALILLPVVGVIVTWFSTALKKAMLKARRKIATLNAFIQECLYGNSTIKVLTAEAAATERFRKYNIDYRDAQMGTVLLDACMFSILDGIASITVGIALYVGVTLVISTDSTALTAGILVAFVQLIQQMFEPLKNLGNKMAMLQGAFTSIDRVFGVLDTKAFVSGEVAPPQLKGKVEFSGVSFRYHTQQDDQTEDWIIRGIDFTARAGTSTAFVGATGSGKSTLIKLLTKLYDGYQGQILIDDQDIAAWDGQQLRQQIAIVPQDIVLFDGSVAFNIGLDRPGISLEKIRHAARNVGADQFIRELPDTYDYRLKEGGTNLSHGQRQLVAFARAIVQNPAILILDEATSSVDAASEAIIQEAVGRLLRGRTTIVIAHRLSTIQQCDQIIVLEKGKILERGNHGELLAKEAAYYQLYHA